MDKNQYYNDTDWEEEDDDVLEIDWVGLLFKLVKAWKFIALFCFAFAVLGVMVALMTPKVYTTTVTLAPESQGRSSNSSLSGMASMLGLGGMTTNRSDALNVTLFPDISRSTPFLVQLFDVEVTPYVSPKDLKKGATPAVPTTLAKYITKEDEKKSWFAEFKESLFGAGEDEVSDTLVMTNLTAKQHFLVRTLQKMISADVDKKTNIITVGVTMDDPWIATTIADTVCNRLQNYVIAYRTQKQQEDVDYYTRMTEEAKEKMIEAQSIYARSVDYDRSVILQSVTSAKERLQQEAQLTTQIYTQMAQQLELSKAKLQEVKPVFTVLEPASMPELPSSTSRKLVVIAFCFVGFCLSSAWKLFGEEFYHNFKNQLNERLVVDSTDNSEETDEK